MLQAVCVATAARSALRLQKLFFETFDNKASYSSPPRPT